MNSRQLDLYSLMRGFVIDFLDLSSCKMVDRSLGKLRLICFRFFPLPPAPLSLPVTRSSFHRFDLLINHATTTDTRIF
jgi:hypothetical protein